LPSKPKIFHGREFELEDIVKSLRKESSRIAILGAGGMGKTSLARAALHHLEITTKYEHRFFVACDSANTSIEITALLGAHLGLKPGEDLTTPVFQYFSRRPSSLLILDNLETAWEPKESQSGIEEFLSRLADIGNLALIITMRGAERPAKVRWTRPFLPPLKPLSDEAALKTFVDIAEDFHKSEDIDRLLHLTDNMPLAVDLIAHLVASEGLSKVLRHWETEKTSILSDSHDRRSSLDASIALSLSSPRMNSLPGAKKLLSLLAILPDGLSDVELLQAELSIQDILRCKATLLGTSLAYTDDNKRLKSLVPIREHVLKFHPPSAHLIEHLRKHFHLLLNLYQEDNEVHQITSKINQITSNLGNLKQVLKRGL
ncbi:P-loop containing nucleoside triphosphate hydrolase protein, partial [Mycena latifolia]